MVLKIVSPLFWLCLCRCLHLLKLAFFLFFQAPRVNLKLSRLAFVITPERETVTTGRLVAGSNATYVSKRIRAMENGMFTRRDILAGFGAMPVMLGTGGRARADTRRNLSIESRTLDVLGRAAKVMG